MSTPEGFRSIELQLPSENTEGLPDGPFLVTKPDLAAMLAAIIRELTREIEPAEQLLELKRRETQRRQLEDQREKYRQDTLWADDETLDRLRPASRLAFVFTPDEEPSEDWERRPIERVRAWYAEADRKRQLELAEARAALLLKRP